MALLGGTLSQLSKDRNISLTELQKLNPQANLNTTYSVSELKFPTVTAPAPVSAPTLAPAPISALDSRPASQLTKEEYAARAGVDVSRVQGTPGDYVIGPAPTAIPQTFQSGGQSFVQPPAPSAPLSGQADQQQAQQNNQALISQLNEQGNADQDAALNAILSEFGKNIDVARSSGLTEKITSVLEGLVASKPTEKSKTLREIFDEEKAKSGISGLEQSLADTDAQIAKLDADFLGITQEQENLPISTREIGRNLSQAEIGYQRKRRELLLEKDRIQNQVTQRYDALNTIMNLEKFDISQATDAYNTRFSQTMQIINAVKGLDESQKNDIERATDNARANAQIVINTMTARGMTANDLSDEQQLKLQNLGLQAGLGQNFFADTLAVSSGKEILTQIVSTDKTYATIVYKDGTTKLVKTGLSPQAPDTPESDVGAKYTTRLKEEIANVYSGRYGKQGARERALQILKAEFPNVRVADDIYNRIPDGYETNIKNTSQTDYNDL